MIVRRDEMRASKVMQDSAIIRRLRPEIVLAPTTVENQHPDPVVLGRMVRDAARLARYGGVKELRSRPPHAIGSLLFYSVAVEGEPAGVQPVWIDVSAATVMEAWIQAMRAHESQAKTRPYSTLQLARAGVNGARCGVPAAIALYPNDPLVFDSLASLRRTARRF